MPAWSIAALSTIGDSSDLFVSPFREDGTTYGTPIRTWALVVDGNVYVRAASGPSSSWSRAAVAQGAGRVRVSDVSYEVTFEAAGDTDEAAIDAAYEAEYPGSSAVTIMQGDDPKAASIRINPS